MRELVQDAGHAKIGNLADALRHRELVRDAGVCLRHYFFYGAHGGPGEPGLVLGQTDAVRRLAGYPGGPHQPPAEDGVCNGAHIIPGVETIIGRNQAGPGAWHPANNKLARYKLIHWGNYYILIQCTINSPMRFK